MLVTGRSVRVKSLGRPQCRILFCPYTDKVSYKKAWYQNHKHKVAERKKLYDKENKQKISEYGKKYRAENRQKLAVYSAEKKKTISSKLKENREEIEVCKQSMKLSFRLC